MKAIGLAFFLFGITTTLNAQSIGAVAKAERQRQHDVEAAMSARKEISAQNNASAEPEHAAKTEESKNNTDHTKEIGDLEHEKETLLVKLNEVIHDRQAVQDIEQRMGEIQKRVVVVESDGEDLMAIHPVMYVALSYDHRVVDGVAANAFLWRVTEILEKAEFEV